MKQKLIIINAVIVFSSLMLLVMISTFIIYKQNLTAYQKNAENYLMLASNIYDGTNSEKAIDAIKGINDNVRLTIIDQNGVVIADTDIKESDENHLDRVELQSNNLGKVFKRYSKTLKCNMIYIAGIKNNHYLRISVAMKDVNRLLVYFIILSFTFAFFIFLVSMLITNKIYKKRFNPINEKVQILSRLAPVSDVNAKTIDDLPQVISSITTIINEKIERINDQKDEINSILNMLKQGIVVINQNQNIVFINKTALTIFNVDESINDKNYLYLIRDIKLQETVKMAFEKHVNDIYRYEYGKNVLEINIVYIDNSWLLGGVIITIDDVTDSEKLAKTKRDFFQNSSHELKSPLTSIIGYQQLIVEDIVDDKQQIIDYSRRTLQEAQRMNRIIMDMLNLSYLEQNYQKKNEEVRVDSVINDIILTLSERMKRQNITLYTKLYPLTILSDKLQIDELIRNIIDNSIKYNKENGKISITLIDGVLTIEDTGIGIPENEQNSVFERFYRVDKGRSKALGGTGLGLAIVKHICEIYDYKLQLNSVLDKGTTIKIFFKVSSK